MRRIVHLVMLFVLAGILVYGTGVMQDGYEAYKQSRQYTKAELQTELMNSDEFTQTLKQMTEDGISFVFWGEQRNALITNADLSRTQTVTAQAVRGDTGCLYPGSNGLGCDTSQETLDLWTDTDEKGCLLDKETARKLFGTTDIIGREVQYLDHTYVIRGILREKKALFVYQSTAVTSTAVYDHVAMRISDGRTAADMVKRLANVYGISSIPAS